MYRIEVFVFDVGWIFFAAWGMALAALSVIVFGRDILPDAHPATVKRERQ
jgi:hypothetical protein